MKRRIRIMLIMFTLFVSSSCFSQSIISMEKDVVASISPTGIVTDANGQQIGEITAAGIIKNYRGTEVGKIIGDRFEDSRGRVLGSKKVTATETQILMGENDVFGTVQSTSKLVDTSGVILLSSTGSVSEIQLLAYFFFF